MYRTARNDNQFDAQPPNGSDRQRISVRPLRRRQIHRNGLRPLLWSIAIGLVIGVVFVPFFRHFLSSVTTKILTFYERHLERRTEVFAQLHFGEMFKRRGQSDDSLYVPVWQKINHENLYSAFVDDIPANRGTFLLSVETLPKLEIEQEPGKAKLHSIELSEGVLPCDTLVTDMRPTGLTQRRRSNVQVVHGRNSLMINGEIYYRFLTPR